MIVHSLEIGLFKSLRSSQLFLKAIYCPKLVLFFLNFYTQLVVDLL